MSEATRHLPASLLVDGEPLFLAKDDKGAPLWRARQVVTQEGDPTVPRRVRYNDWSRGLGDSRGVFRGAVEHCAFAFLGLIGRILPAHAVTVITTNANGPVAAMEEVTVPARRILVGGGTNVVEVDPTTFGVTATATMPGGTVRSLQLFHNEVAIALGNTQQFFRRDATGAYLASTTTTGPGGDYRFASAFGLSGSSLARGHRNFWSKCDAANFHGVNGNWSVDYRVGDPNGNINQVFDHNRWDYVLKDEGLFSFDPENSEAANLLTDLRAFRSPENRQYAQWHDQLLICSFAGLYRYLQQGAARTAGAEEMELNEGVLADTFPTAAIGFGKWAFVAHFRASTNITYLVMHRRAREGDATFGVPLTASSVLFEFSGRCNAMRLVTVGSSPQLWFGMGGNVGVITLTRDGRPQTYQTANVTRVDFSPTDLGSPMTVKFARSIECVGRNVDAGRTVQWRARFDGGAWQPVGPAITSLTNTFAQRFWTPGTNDSGRVLQLAVELTNNSGSSPPEVRDAFLNYEERPILVDGAICVLRFRDFDAEGDIASRRTAREMREFVQGLLDGPPRTLVDPYGNTYRAAFAVFEGEPNFAYAGLAPQEAAELQIRRLDYT